MSRARAAGLGELHSPPGVAVLVAELCGLLLPLIGNAALLDCFLLVVRIALARRGDEARIDDLARHGDVAHFPQHRVETLEKCFDGSSFRELLAE